MRALGLLVAAVYDVLRTRGRVDAGLTNWWRSPEHNLRVGGAPTSQHLAGLAFDVVGPDAIEVARSWQRLGGSWIHESDHEHLQLFSAAQHAQYRRTGLA